MTRKHCLLILFLAGWSGEAFSQKTCDCLANYTFVYSQLKEAKSYSRTGRSQRNRIDSLYRATARRLESQGDLSVLDCFTLAARLVMEVDDNHNTFETRPYPMDMQSWDDEGMMRKFRESPEYNAFPFYRGNLDSLAASLSDRSPDEVEGIFSYGNHTRLLLTRENGIVNGYVLETALKPWSRGELMLRLLPQEGERYKLIFGHPVNKQLNYSYEKYQEGYLMQLRLRKSGVGQQAHHQEMYVDQTYLLKSLNDTTQYLKIGSFSSSAEGIGRARAFCDSVAGKLNAGLLIVDLRGNTGGYRTNGKHFEALLAGYRGRMVFLTNFRTKSYAEIFALRWKRKPNVTLAGMSTSGVLAYSRNYPDKAVSGDGCFLTHFTDRGGLLYTRYENRGVAPDLYLDFSKDWIEQVIGGPHR